MNIKFEKQNFHKGVEYINKDLDVRVEGILSHNQDESTCKEWCAYHQGNVINRGFSYIFCYNQLVNYLIELEEENNYHSRKVNK